MNDRELLRHYVEERSETAFTELVARHLNLVYATALRLVNDPTSAQDVTQSVFIQLARKARFIREGNALPGWLYRATSGIAKNHIRSERRRRDREGEAMTRIELEPHSSLPLWESIAPLVEDAMRQLNQREQNAMVLRFFEDKPLMEVGRALDISEDAAQKRISRALDKLRSYFLRRGITISATVLAATLTIPATYAAPPALFNTVAPAAFAAGSANAIGIIAGLIATKFKAAVAILSLVAIGVFVVVILRKEPSRFRSSFATFGGVGDLPGGQFMSYASAVSGDGKVIVGVSQSANGNEAFRRTVGGGIIGLGDLPAGIFSSSANGVSFDGSVIVGSSSSALGPQAFRWTPRAEMTGIGDLPGGIASSVAYGVSANGQFVVGESSSARAEREAFRWQVTEMIGLGSFAIDAFNSQAMAASADSSVVIGSSARSRVSFEAFRWTQAGGMIGLGDFPGGVTNSNAYGVSPDGRFVVGYGCPGTFDPYTHEAFRWTEQTGLEHLGFAPGTRNSAAYAVSADGNVIVGDNKSEQPSLALIWTPTGGMRLLQEVLTNDFKLALKGWQLTSARGVSHDGKTIVGSGVNPSGQTEGWFITLQVAAHLKGKP